MRIKELDFLRGIAILLVLCRHGDMHSVFKFIGWTGVDLFFVMSGFLVSGLVLKEYLNTQTVHIGRFLIRRGFKIYPSFYFFILSCIALKYFYSHTFYDWKLLVSEIFFLQSYLDRMWSHTWSIAVEEHFYFGLAFFTWMAVKYTLIEKKQLVVPGMVVFMLIAFLLRLKAAYPHRDEISFAMFATHLRLDGILTGSFLAYLYYMTGFYEKVTRYRKSLLLSAFILIFPVFQFEGGSFFMNTIGITSMNISFSILILIALTGRFSSLVSQFRPIHFLFRITCFIGVHSYSIYLWHLLLKKITDLYKTGPCTSFFIYLVCSIILGIFISLFIEKPFLKMRERLISGAPSTIIKRAVE